MAVHRVQAARRENDPAVRASIHERFDERTRRTPDAVALTSESGSMSYGELADRSDALAWQIRSHDVTTGAVVGILAVRSIDVVVGLLAILKAGAAYLPLDPSDPVPRLSYMLENTRARMVLSPLAAAARFDGGVCVLPLDEPDTRRVTAPPPLPTVDADDLAYVCYTSGSTGAPKGVAIPHRAVLRLADAGVVPAEPDDVFLSLAPLTFDAATFELWTPLLNGSRLALYPPGPVVLSGLAEFLGRQGVTTLWLTAGLFQRIVDRHFEALEGVRYLVTGGDVVSPAHVNIAREAHPTLQIFNGYGPTENTTFTCCHRVREFVGVSVPIGLPIDGTEVYVLSADLEPVGAGEVGELFAAGSGLAQGYVGRAAETAAYFLPDPFAARPGQRMYRTGDIVRRLPSGALDFVGRIDEQVKIRGFRVEPAEVEAAVRRIDGVRDCRVVARDDVVGERKVLVAYVLTPVDVDAAQHAAFLRRELRLALPDHMVPTAIVAVDDLPLTANGKVDRARLPVPSLSRREVSTSYVAPRSPTEGILCDLWCDVLAVEEVGVFDDFFEIGGDSLLAADLVARVQTTMRVRVETRQLFECSTVAAFAEVVSIPDDTAAGETAARAIGGSL